MRRVGILVVSDRASAGQYEDLVGPLVRNIVTRNPGWEIASQAIIPDEHDSIRDQLITWVDDDKLDLNLTAGGTGFAPRDVTPEAARSVIEREAPGMAEAMRQAGLLQTPHAMLLRGVCGIRGDSLIINLPGSPKAVRENLDVILQVLPHALDLLTETPGAESRHTSTRRA